MAPLQNASVWPSQQCSMGGRFWFRQSEQLDDLVLSHELEHGGAIALQLALPDAAYALQGIGALRPFTRNVGESGVMEDDVGWHVLIGGALAAPGAQGFKEGKVGRFHRQAIAAAPPDVSSGVTAA
jgi:hypothetical protein